MEGDITAKASPARSHSSNSKARLAQRASEVPLAPGHHQRYHYPSRIHPAKPQPPPSHSHTKGTLHHSQATATAQPHQLVTKGLARQSQLKACKQGSKRASKRASEQASKRASNQSNQAAVNGRRQRAKPFR